MSGKRTPKHTRIVRGAHFVDERVPADGREFHDCQFTNAPLVYRGGEPFMLFGTSAAGIQLVFEGPAANTLNTLRGFYAFGGHELVEQVIATIRNPHDQPIN